MSTQGTDADSGYSAAPVPGQGVELAQVRVELGLALQRRGPEVAQLVVDACRQRLAVDSPEWMTESTATATFATAALASELIGRWFAQGVGHTEEDWADLDKTGTRTANQDFPLVKTTQNYISWRELTLSFLREDAELLVADPAVVREGVDAVVSGIRFSNDVSLLAMVEAFMVQHDALAAELAREHAKLRHLATHDPLTGLVNRTQLFSRLDQALAASTRRDGEVAVFFLDVDLFKSINDELGHDAGDRLLRACAERMLSCARPGDTVARFGGDEFVIVCSDLVGPDAAYAVRDRIRRSLDQPFTIPDETSVRVSIGLAVAGADDDATRLLARADTAMYEDKVNPSYRSPS